MLVLLIFSEMGSFISDRLACLHHMHFLPSWDRGHYAWLLVINSDYPTLWIQGLSRVLKCHMVTKILKLGNFLVTDFAHKSKIITPTISACFSGAEDWAFSYIESLCAELQDKQDVSLEDIMNINDAHGLLKISQNYTSFLLIKRTNVRLSFKSKGFRLKAFRLFSNSRLSNDFILVDIEKYPVD